MKPILKLCEAKMKKILKIGLMALMLSACASAKEEEPKSAEDLYKDGYQYMLKTSWDRAAETFEKVEIEHPYSRWAVKAKLMGAYAHYKNKDYDDAVMSLERFIKFHPGNKDAPYAYYMKGLCYYDQISPADKDQSNTSKAQDAFQQLIVLYPQTPYAIDASHKMNLILDHLAGQEMEIGRYYLKQKNYLSALNRFNTVVKDYPNTPQVEEALYRTVELYVILGMKKEAETSVQSMQANYPQSKWTEKAEKTMK